VDRVYTAAFKVLAATSALTPASQVFALETNHLADIELIVPAGHCGFTGFAITYQGTQVFPFAGAAWHIADNDKFVIPWNDEIMAGGLVLHGYNTDIFDHTFYLRAKISNLATVLPVVTDAPQAGGGTPAADLTSIGALTSGGDATSGVVPVTGGLDVSAAGAAVTLPPGAVLIGG
jgi:hypothetical protein